MEDQREGWRWALERMAIAGVAPDLGEFLSDNNWPSGYADLLTNERVPAPETRADLQEEANRLGVTLEFLQWLQKGPSIVHFDTRIIVAESRWRCPECKEYFQQGERVVQRNAWWYHPPCVAKFDARKTNAEHTPRKSEWAARGRVIRKGGGL